MESSGTYCCIYRAEASSCSTGESEDTYEVAVSADMEWAATASLVTTLYVGAYGTMYSEAAVECAAEGECERVYGAAGDGTGVIDGGEDVRVIIGEE